MEQLGVAQFGFDRLGGLEPATYVRNLVYRTKADWDLGPDEVLLCRGP